MRFKCKMKGKLLKSFIGFRKIQLNALERLHKTE